MSDEFHHEVRVYYEDTDLSGAVYHANYLKFFERAREHAIGPERLADLYDERGLGFVVYRVDIDFRGSAELGDVLDIRSTVERESDFRAVFHQSAWYPDGDRPLVGGEIELACVDDDGDLARLPGLLPTD